MRKHNRRNGTVLQRILALALVATIAAGALPTETVQARKLIAVSREEIEFEDWRKTEETEEETPKETQADTQTVPSEEVQAESVSNETCLTDETSVEEMPPAEHTEAEQLSEEFSSQEGPSQERSTEETRSGEESSQEESLQEASSENTLSESVLSDAIVAELGQQLDFKLSADKEGIYDYRTDYGTPLYLYVEQKKTFSNRHISALFKEEKMIISVLSTDETVALADTSKAYSVKDGKIPLTLKSIGETTLVVSVTYNDIPLGTCQRIKIELKNSALCDEDFIISIIDGENKEKERFTSLQEWQAYLAAHDQWVNSNVRICLTETGAKYYDRIMVRYGSACTQETFFSNTEENQAIKNCCFWAEHDAAKALSYAKARFDMGMDQTAPVIDTFLPDNDYFTPASTENSQYFSKNFVLKGSYRDTESKVAAIEYTTDLDTEGTVVWKPLEQFEKALAGADFTLTLEDGIYDAVAVRAVDRAGNVSEPACLKSETDEFVKVVVDRMPPDIEVLTVSDGQTYSAEGENWTNKEIQFTVSEKPKAESSDLAFLQFNGYRAGLYRVEYAYQSIASALRGEPVNADAWHALEMDENGKAHLSIGESSENPINRNGYYYFRGTSKAGVSSETYVEKRVLLWQKMAEKKSIIQSNADIKKSHNEWYNLASGSPILNFAYPDYDTGVISGEYAAPITIHYNLTIKDEENLTTPIAEDKTAGIHADIPQNSSTDKSFTGFTEVSDDLSYLQITFPKDGIYTLEYWITDAAGNESEKDIFTYKIDCSAPTDLKLVLADEEMALGSERTLLYEKFYREGISGQATANYGISGKESIKILKAKQIGDWKKLPPNEDAEHFQVNPNMRCLLYIRATDGAGNMTERWTKGIIVDNEAPTGDGAQELIIEPKGANKHGFFNKDVTLSIGIQDSPTDQNSAALKSVTESINVNGTDLVLNKELFSSTEENISEEIINRTQNVTITETLDAKVNEGNRVSVTVTAVDRSENISSYTRELKIDVTKPEIEIIFDNKNARNGRYYNQDRRATIRISELNFDPALVKIDVERNGQDFSPAISEWHSDKMDHYAYVDFTADGDYTLNVKCKDLADNESEEKSAEPFTIDKTAPNVTIALENSDLQKNFFNETQTAVITVVEHNFNADDVWINMQPVGKIGAWEHKNDTHVIKVQFLSEGTNMLSCEYRDLAGNDIAEEDKAKMPLELIIDKTAPVIDISGVENNSANSGEIVPVITVLDANIDPLGTAITLTTGRGAAVEIASDITAAFADGGFVYTLNGLDAKPDDIYYLAVSTVDLAGNTLELTYRFSLNRRGSAYDVTDFAKVMEQYYNSCRTFEDIKIIEMNVDKVEDFELYLSHNTDILYGERGSRPLHADEHALLPAVYYSVEMSGNEDTGYVYTYTIYRENFMLEGTYRLGIYSRDRAGNEVNNLLRLNGEEIQFVIDNTLPRVRIEGIENNEIYDAVSREVRIAADDNFKLADAEITLVNSDNEVLEHWNYFDLVEKEGDTAIITIGEHKEEISLLYRATDVAGNEVRALQGEKAAKADFLVTTDKFVQFVNKPAKTPIGRMMIAVFVLMGISLAGIFVIAIGKRKRKKIR